MSVHYIIDGYNVIKQVKFFTGKKLRSSREGLLRFIEIYRPQGSSRNEVTVVFDGRADVVAGPQIKSKVQVIFSKNESADEKIKRMVERSPNPSCIIVVSDDKEIIYYCRSLGARIKSTPEFLEKLINIPNKPQTADEHDKPELNSEMATKITEQLKHIWLKDK